MFVNYPIIAKQMTKQMSDRVPRFSSSRQAFSLELFRAPEIFTRNESDAMDV